MKLQRREIPELKRREIAEIPPELDEAPIKVIRPCLERFWGGYLLDVPDECEFKRYVDTNDRLNVQVVECIMCKRYCPESVSKKCEAGKWLFKTSKTRIRIQREGS